jgi:pimeloyl-ACP methyl ester carboxylesterase
VPLVLVGNSQGGRIAIDFALRSPDLVRALVLIAPAIGGAPEPALDGPVSALARAIDAADAAGVVDEVNRLEALAWLDGPAGPEGRAAPEARALFLAMNRIALASEDAAADPAPTTAHDRLEELRMPVSVIVGTLDLPHVIARGRELAARAPRAELVVMDAVAHLPQLERPNEVATLIRTAIAAA